jgi:hypothetical protein
MPKKGRSKSHNRSHEDDGSAEMCRKHKLTPMQYAEIVHCHSGHADRARGSSRARTDGGRSGHTSRAASPSRGPPRDEFKDAVKRRYKIACDYVKGDEVLLAKYSRNELLAKAYELEKLKSHDLVVNSLQDHGISPEPYLTESLEKFGPRDDPLTYKKRNPKAVYGKMWAQALEQMNSTGYAWDEHYSKHELRALLLQQCGDRVEEHNIPLQEYIIRHPRAKDEFNKEAKTMYPKDEETKTKFTYEIRKNRRYAVAGHLATHPAPHTALHPVEHHEHAQHPPTDPLAHHHGKQHATNPHGAVRATRPMVRSMGHTSPSEVSDVDSVMKPKGAFAVDDFGDDLPDDYRV